MLMIRYDASWGNVRHLVNHHCEWLLRFLPVEVNDDARGAKANALAGDTPKSTSSANLVIMLEPILPLDELP